MSLCGQTPRWVKIDDFFRRGNFLYALLENALIAQCAYRRMAVPHALSIPLHSVAKFLTLRARTQLI